MLTDHLEFHSARNKVELNELWPNKKTRKITHELPVNSQNNMLSNSTFIMSLNWENAMQFENGKTERKEKNSWQICTYLVNIHWADTEQARNAESALNQSRNGAKQAKMDAELAVHCC